jgi:hypothetical protein
VERVTHLQSAPGQGDDLAREGLGLTDLDLLHVVGGVECVKFALLVPDRLEPIVGGEAVVG